MDAPECHVGRVRGATILALRGPRIASELRGFVPVPYMMKCCRV